MKFTLDQIKKFIEEDVRDEFETDDDWLNTRYMEVAQLTGHTNPYYLLFYVLAEMLEPKLVVELGSWRAYGAAHFASGNPNTTVVTVDIHKDEAQKMDHEKAIEIANWYPNLHFIHAWTWDAAPLIYERFAKETPIDILFVDAWHKYEYVKRELELYTPMLNDEALIIFDDVMDADGATESMLKLWDEIKYDKFINTRLHDGIPMGYVKYEV